MMEQEKIIQPIKNMFNGADERNWAKVEDAMAETITLDFSSMTGEGPSVTTAKQIAENWAGFLPGFEKTHHQISDFEVIQKGNHATVHYTGKADHILQKSIWTVEATYDTELSEMNGQWLITKHTLNFIRQTGDTSLPAKAQAIMKTKSN